MTAILFPGQGCQTPGMGQELLEAYPDLRALYDCGSAVLGYDLYDLCMHADAETLSRTAFAQPAIYVTSLVCCEAAKRSGLTASAAAGHSLGEYAAMTVCGILTPEEGFRALKIRADAMDRAAAQSESGMAAVLRLSAEQVAEICEKTEGYVLPVNFNAPEQTVIAGDLPALEAASAACQAAGARVTRLAVSAAFHSARMAAAAETIRTEFRQLHFQAPTLPFYTNLTGTALAADTDMADYCAAHCVNPVRFTDELRAMRLDGRTDFVELGPKRVLTRLVQQTLPDATACCISDTKTLAAFAAQSHG